jgi:arylsulfatase A-like enzyme
MSQHTPPNIVIIMTDQQQARLRALEGYPLDTTPFLDQLARQGVWFDKGYTAVPVCGPARISLFTGRFPSAHKARGNFDEQDAVYTQDMVDIVKSKGYQVAMIGKNHSHLTRDRCDHWFELMHDAGYSTKQQHTEQEVAFDQWLYELKHRVAIEPTPFPLACQGPYRAVSSAEQFLASANDKPFFMWLSFAEPHNPYQVCEPYFSMFPPESLPPLMADASTLEERGFKWRFTKQLGKSAIPDYDELIPRMRSNYLGMLRLIDDQIKRFIDILAQHHLRENTILFFVSDHGDFVGEYGLMRKGAEIPEALMRIPFQVTGPGIAVNQAPHPAHVSLIDIMPTICDIVGEPLPDGVQGRSIWPILTGEPYPTNEFDSIYAEHGIGGLPYNDADHPDIQLYQVDMISYNELNSYTQGGFVRMVRKEDWKLIFDSEGIGQLYHLASDPAELHNLYDNPAYSAVLLDLMKEMQIWQMRAVDPLPNPKSWPTFTEPGVKKHPRNYWRI